MTAETAMTAETRCLRCGGANLVSAHLEQPLAFCLDHAAHHGRLRLGLQALLCRACGHVEFQAPDPSQVIGAQVSGQQAAGSVLQEEDF